MAFPTKDGKSFGSRFKQRKYDSMHSSELGDKKIGEGNKSFNQPNKGSVPKETSRTNDQGEAKFSASKASEGLSPEPNTKAMNMGNEAPEAAASVVEHHGPATSVSVHHDHKNGKHKVVSHHSDGHMHSSDHTSAQEAHDAGAQLGGEANTENADTAANEDQTSDNSMFGNDNFQTPRLA